MAEEAKTQEQVKRNKDGFVPGQRVSAKELALFRNKRRKAGK